MIYLIVIGVSVCAMLWKIFKNNRKFQQPPVLTGKLPLVGHIGRFFCNTVDMYKLLIQISEECTSKGGLAVFYIGLRKVYVVTDPEDCLTISNTCLGKEKVYNLAKPWLGNGLLISSGQTWKKHRKLLNPAFSQPVLNSFIGIFNSQARDLVKLFAEEIGKPFDHEKTLRLNNLETICMTSMGISGEKHRDLREQYISLASRVLSIITERFKRLWLHSDFFFGMSELKKEQDNLLKSLKKLSNQIIKEKKAKMKIDEKSHVENNSGKIKPFMDLILELAEETGCFTDDEVKEETDNIIVAGHDTSASVLTYVFTLLGSYPHIQAKIYDEVIKVFGNADNDLEKDDLSKLVYTDAVIKETLRLYPIGLLNARFIDQEVKLKNYTLEPNTGCFLMIAGLHRHPIWGPDANEFKPERWLHTTTLPDLNYFGGFAVGRRSCIGKVYAMMSMKVTIAHVVRRYRISADVTKIILKWEVMTRPHSGHDITLELRK